MTAVMRTKLTPPVAAPLPIPLAAVQLIAGYEQGPNGGPALRAYKCPAGVWTLGFGETDGIKPGMACTEQEAWSMLIRDLTARTVAVTALVKNYVEPDQLGAMVSLAYNIGMGAFAKSTVLRAHNAGDHDAAARAFALWNKAKVNGRLQVLRGLTARRASEAALYLTPEQDAYREPMAQAVEHESKLTASPIAQGGAATTGVGLFGLASTGWGVTDIAQQSGTMSAVSDFLTKTKALLADGLGIPPEWLLPTVLVLVGGVIVYQRLRQRRQGWA